VISAALIEAVEKNPTTSSRNLSTRLGHSKSTMMQAFTFA